MTSKAWTCVGLVLAFLAAGLAVFRPALADVIHLKNGNQIQVDAWRDAGDAIEFARGGGIVRILKTEVRKVDGAPTRGWLRMYSAPTPPPPAPGTETSAPAGGAAPEGVTGRMVGLLDEGEALLTRDALPDEKVIAYRRIVTQWRALDVPASLTEAYRLGEQAMVFAMETFAAQDAGGEVQERIVQARKDIAAAQEAIKKATAGG